MHLQVTPDVRTFTCRLTSPASDTPPVVRLNLNGRFKLQQVTAPQAEQQRVASVVYLGDTIHQTQVRYDPNPHRSRYIKLVQLVQQIAGPETGI